jgi:hypothetical protein
VERHGLEDNDSVERHRLEEKDNVERQAGRQRQCGKTTRTMWKGTGWKTRAMWKDRLEDNDIAGNKINTDHKETKFSCAKTNRKMTVEPEEQE